MLYSAVRLVFCFVGLLLVVRLVAATLLPSRISPTMNTFSATFLVSLVAMLLFLVDGAHCFDAGDGICLTLGLIVGFILIFAALGWWSRRESA